MKKILPIGVFLILAFIAFKFTTQKEQQESNNINEKKEIVDRPKSPKKTPEVRALYAEERALYEYKLQANPATGLIPQEEKRKEFLNAQKAKTRLDGGDNLRAPDATFVNRGPSNLGGRTRAFVVDISDNTGNTIIAGGVSGGVFKTTNGGASWTKVSANNEIHNVTSIAQDPTNTNIWYYGTGEARGNSASGGAGSFYLGQGIWKSTNSGNSWTQIASTDSDFESFSCCFDLISKLAVHPITGDLFAATGGQIQRYNGTSWTTELTNSFVGTSYETDVVITDTGIVYASFSGLSDTDIEGVWQSPTGTGSWTRISNGVNASGGSTLHARLNGRAVLGLGPDPDGAGPQGQYLYVLFVNGFSGIEADLFRYIPGLGFWNDFSSKLPDEPGGSSGNDPFAVQGGYDLVVSVRPSNQNFVVIGGTNAYKISDIDNDATFSRIGGYAGPNGYAQYANHHPDIHAMVFNPFNDSVLFTGTDGGVHRTDNIDAASVTWTSLNNNYQTQQYYHVAIDPLTGSDFVLGGLQDNGTNQGGLSAGQSNLTEQQNIFSGDGVAVAISRDNVNIPTFVGTQYGSIYRRNKNLSPGFINANIKPSGTPDGSSSPRAEFVTYFYLDQDNNNVLYYAANENLYRTNDASNSTSTVGSGTSDWNNLGTPTSFGSQSIRRLTSTWGTYNAATSYLLIGGEAGKVVRLDDPHNATLASSGIDITPSGATGYVSDIAIHPTNRDIVLLTYSNYGVTNIYITTDATAASPTWYNAELNLSSHSIRSAAITTNTSGEALYVVGTARGLYSSTNPIGAPLGGSAVNWTREAPNLIGYAVVSSMSYRPADNKLLIGTHGNGMFEATINHVLGLEDNEFSENIRLYPNPVKNNLNLNMSNELSKDATFIINNALGQNVMKGSIENNQVNVNNLNSGIYFIQISSNGNKGVKRFIKE